MLGLSMKMRALLPAAALLLSSAALMGQTLTSKDLLAQPPPPPADHRLPYGTGLQQFGDLRLPSGPGPHPLVVMIHGGCYRAEFDLTHLDSFCAALADAGIATWNVEYRRIGNEGGGWPGTFDDISRAVDHVRHLANHHPLDLDRVVLAGHSAGGHLALWAAGRSGLPEGSSLRVEDPLTVRGVVALAAVTDLREAVSRQVCDDAVVVLLGGQPSAEPERYREMSPIERLPLGIPQWIVVGPLDGIVPPALGERYATVARRAGDPVTLITLPRAGHFEMVVPTAQAWPRVTQVFREALGAAP